jgi:hypothetical protein
MEQEHYKIRKAFLYPLGLDCLLLFCLVATTLLMKGESAEKLVFTLFFLPSLVIFLECLHRQVGVAEQGLAVRKLWRRKEVSWDEITHVGCLHLHKKVYLLLTTVKGFLIISSAYERFGALAETIVAHVARDRVEEEVCLHAGRSVTLASGVASAWVAAAALAGIILMKLLPYVR